MHSSLNPSVFDWDHLDCEKHQTETVSSPVSGIQYHQILVICHRLSTWPGLRQTNVSYMDDFWKGRRVLVTGGAGFIGSHLVDELVKRGAKVRIADNLSRGSLTNLRHHDDEVELQKIDLTEMRHSLDACRDMDVVLSLAARVSGIQFNRTHSGDMFRINTNISMNVLEAARLLDIERLLVVSSACVYPRNSSIPTPESEGFNEDPEPSNWGYGWAKRFSEIQARAYGDQYGMKVGIVRPYNTYGPRDHFDLSEAHVIPALIKRIEDGEEPLKVWGSGDQTRSFIYVKDLIIGILLAIEKHPSPEPINIGSEEEISIRNLVHLIQDKLSAKRRILFDKSKPEGQLRRRPDVEKARKLLGFEARTSIRDGIEETVNWYRRELELPWQFEISATHATR